jgi:predicted dehydrogenase
VSEPLRTIHVGVGGRGRWPLEVLGADERFRPVALVDPVAEHRAAARAQLGLPEEACFADLPAAIGVDADALVVCTPTRTHAAICRAGFAAGRHVLVEKGMTLDWAEAGALVAEAAAAGVRFCVSQNYRYTAEVRTLRQAIESGRYGAPHLVDLINHRHRPEPRTLDYPGAMVWDMACHHFDNLVHLFGPVARATAITHNAPWSPYAHDAGVTAALEFASGPVCSYVLTHQATVPEYRWVLQSEDGALRPARPAPPVRAGRSARAGRRGAAAAQRAGGRRRLAGLDPWRPRARHQRPQQPRDPGDLRDGPPLRRRPPHRRARRAVSIRAGPPHSSRNTTHEGVPASTT